MHLTLDQNHFSGIIKFFQENEILKKKHQEQLDNVFNQDSNRENIQDANFIEPQVPSSDPLMIDGASLGMYHDIKGHIGPRRFYSQEKIL